MKLFNKTIDRQLFKQYALGSDLSKQEVVVKIFNPVGNGTWFILNSDPEDPDYLWAIVDLGYGAEVGSVSRTDLETYRGRFGLGFERDLSFDPVNAEELYEGLRAGKFYADGGHIENFSDNQRMIMNQNVEVEHHHEELEDILEEEIEVPAWVVAKMETATQNLSDVTHYLDGQKELKEDQEEEYGEFDYSNLDGDDDEIKNKEVVEPINVSAGTKTEMTKNFTDNAWGNLRGFLKGMEGIDLRDDYTFDYKDEQFEIEPIINSDENGVSNAVFSIFDGDGEEQGEVTYSRNSGKQKFTANSELFGWNNSKFEDGGYFDGTIPNVSTYMSNYAKGGKMDSFIPNVGTIDMGKLKSLLIKNSDVKSILSDKEFEFLKNENTDAIGVSGKPFNTIITDGNQEIEFDLKKNVVVKHLKEARDARKSHYSANHAKGGELNDWIKGTSIRFKTNKEATERLNLMKNHNFTDNEYRGLRVEKTSLGYVVKFEFKGKMEDGGFMENVYADGGEIAKAEVFGMKRNFMGTTDIEMKISGMRKAQDFIVYPIGADDAGSVITIQSDTRIGQINLVKGVGVMSQSHSNGAYFVHLQMDKLTPFTISESDLQNIKSHIFKTAGDNVGSRGIVSDNSGASRLFADGGGIGFIPMDLEETLRITAHWGGTDIKGVIGFLNAMIDSDMTDEDLKPKPTKSGIARQNAIDKKTREIWSKIEPNYKGGLKGNMYYSTIHRLVDRANTPDQILKRFKPFRNLQKDSFADGGYNQNEMFVLVKPFSDSNEPNGWRFSYASKQPNGYVYFPHRGFEKEPALFLKEEAQKVVNFKNREERGIPAIILPFEKKAEISDFKNLQPRQDSDEYSPFSPDEARSDSSNFSDYYAEGGKVDAKLSLAKVKSIAQETADFLGSDFTVTEGTIDEASFDLDYKNEKFDGGSYLIMTNGDVVNFAIPSKPIVYNYKTKKEYAEGGFIDKYQVDRFKQVMNGKAIAKYIVRLQDSFGNKETYVFGIKLSDQFRGCELVPYEVLYGGWSSSGTPFSLSNLQVEKLVPNKFFNIELDEEQTEMLVNKLVKNNEAGVKKFLNNAFFYLTYNKSFEDVLRGHFALSVANLISVDFEIVQKFAEGGYNEPTTAEESAISISLKNKGQKFYVVEYQGKKMWANQEEIEIYKNKVDPKEYKVLGAYLNGKKISSLEKGGIPKRYILKADIKTVTVKRNGKEVTYKVGDIVNATNVISEIDDLTSKANYITKFDVIEVELKDASVVEPVSGYWIKKSAKPIGADLTPNPSAESGTKIDTAEIRKDPRGNWRAETFIEDFDGFDWKITTIKTYSGQLLTSAQGGKTMDSGSKGISMFSYTMYQDPHHTLEVSKPKRLTEKVVSEQHDKGLAKFKKFMETGMFKGGGKISNFDKLSAKVAKQYEGKAVKNPYQEEYGKYYSKEEAQEVGDKVAGKVKAMQGDSKAFGGLFSSAKNLMKPSVKYPNLTTKQVQLKSGRYVQVFNQTGDKLDVIFLGDIDRNVKPHTINIDEVDLTTMRMGGEVEERKPTAGSELMKKANILAKEIRKDGESWLDARKRAFAQLKK